jgi:hypothetical protein
MSSSRISAARLRAGAVKRVLAAGSALALAATFVALRGHTGNAATSSGGSQAPASSGATQQQSGGLSGGTVTPAPQTVQPQVQTHTS